MGFLVQNRSIPPESLNPLLRRCSSAKASRSHPMDEQALWFQTSLDSSQKLNSSVLEGSRQFLNSFKLSSTLVRPIFVSQEGKVLWVREGRFNWCVTERQEQVVSFVFLFWLRLSPHRKKSFLSGIAQTNYPMASKTSKSTFGCVIGFFSRTVWPQI